MEEILEMINEELMDLYKEMEELRRRYSEKENRVMELTAAREAIQNDRYPNE